MLNTKQCAASAAISKHLSVLQLDVADIVVIVGEGALTLRARPLSGGAGGGSRRPRAGPFVVFVPIVVVFLLLVIVLFLLAISPPVLAVGVVGLGGGLGLGTGCRDCGARGVRSGFLLRRGASVRRLEGGMSLQLAPVRQLPRR